MGQVIQVYICILDLYVPSSRKSEYNFLEARFIQENELFAVIAFGIKLSKNDLEKSY